jgi:hypothetical protein
MYFFVHISWMAFPYLSTYSSWLAHNSSTHSTLPIRQFDYFIVVTLVFLVLLKWMHILYTFTLINTDCISIDNYFSLKKKTLRSSLKASSLKLYYYLKHSPRRFLLPIFILYSYHQQLNRLTYVALLWFPPVGLNQYSNPLRCV